MGKNKNNAAKSAAEQAAAQQAAPEVKTEQKPADESTKQQTISVIQLGDLQKFAEMSKSGNMDHNHIMDMIRVQHETFRTDPKAAEHTGISQENIDKINQINALEQIALMASVTAFDQTPFAVTMRTAQLEAIQEVSKMLGIVIDQKALPAPDAKGDVQFPSTAIQVSKEAEEAIKEEQAVAQQPAQLDPTKIESEDELKKSLLQILVKGNGSTNLYDKINTAINFYESYLGVQAGKAEDPEAARAALKEKSRVELLSDISHLLGKCTFTISGIAKFMYENTQRTKSPVVAFCTLRDASINEKTGVPKIEDQLVADIVKVLIRWYADTKIAESNRQIADAEKGLEILKKDAEKNKKGIASGEQTIEKAKKYIKEVEQVVGYVNQPSREVADNFIEDYTDNKRENFKMARMIGSKIAKSYYSDVTIKDVEMDSLIHNLQQYVGIITNMFLPSMDQYSEYSEANISELKMKEEATEELKNE